VPVPTEIGDLDTAAANNSPSGSDQRSQADDYLRAHAAFIAQIDTRAPISVVEYGAVGDGTTDNTTAFTNAAADSDYVYVPDGRFKVTSGLDYWKFYGPGQVFETGQEWQVNSHPQNGAALKNYRERTFGNYENAVGASVSINSTDDQERANTQIQGTTTQGTATTGAYDHVGQYVQSYSFDPDETSGSTTYTSTTIVDTSIGTYNATAGRIKPGMFVKTNHGTPYGGRIQSVSGNTITVDAWYLFGTGVAGTPADSTGAQINPNDKVWGMNVNVFANGTAGDKQAQKAAGIEVGVGCDASTGPNVWGVDVVTLGAGTPEMHYVSRGARTYAYFSRTGADFGFVSDDNDCGFQARDPDTAAFKATVSSVDKWSVGASGLVVGDFRSIRVISSGSGSPITDGDNFLLISTTDQIDLPTPVGRTGRVFTVRALASVTIGTAASTIDGGSTKAVGANSSTGFISDGTYWYSCT
jgi:hypothetical protein